MRFYKLAAEDVTVFHDELDLAPGKCRAKTGGGHAGRFGWSGGLGTDFFVDPDGTIGILLAQVDLDEQVMALFNEFQQLVPPH